MSDMVSFILINSIYFTKLEIKKSLAIKLQDSHIIFVTHFEFNYTC